MKLRIGHNPARSAVPFGDKEDFGSVCIERPKARHDVEPKAI